MKDARKLLFCGFFAMLFALGGVAETFAQGPAGTQVQASGQVVDASGDPLVGVTVIVKGDDTRGTLTDVNGRFSLNCGENDTLVFSYLGYSEIEAPAKGNLARLVMNESSELMDEVIVIGYGTTTRKSAIGAVDQVHKNILENRPVPNMTMAIQGAAPNVIIQRKSQNPNNRSTNFNIRGISTTSSNDPLFVIDGLIADATAFDNLNPMDVESISILKDAGTAAIYGSRASNGVILVTTKTGGLNQKPTVKFNGMVGWNQPNILFRPVKGYQNATLRNMAATNDGFSPLFTPEQIADLAAHQDEESWFMDELFRTAMQQNYNVSVQGGTNKTSYLVSFGYFDQESNYASIHHLGTQRYNFRTNVQTEFKKLKIGAIMSYVRDNSLSSTGGNLEIDASRVPTYYYYKMRDENGHYLLNDVLGQYNSLGALDEGTNDYRNNYLSASLTAEYKIIDGLKLRGVMGADINNNTRYTTKTPVQYWADGVARPVNDKDTYAENWSSNAARLNMQLLLDFNRSFGKHNVNALFGGTNESYTSFSHQIRHNYVNNELFIPSEDTTGELDGQSGYTYADHNSRTSITSLIGRAGYNYDERYYAEFSFRYDGSSKFHKDSRWGFFPSVTAGWRMSEEAFMESYKEKVGELKIRGSWGVLGNQAVGDYDRFTRYNNYNNGYVFDNTGVMSSGFNLGNQYLSWESTRTVNVGLDASFFHNSLFITFDYFHKRTNDILMSPTVPSVFGTSLPSDNIGSMDNQGWELSVNYRLNAGQTHHAFMFNIGDSQNKLTKLVGHETISRMDIYRLRREGVALDSYYGYKSDGLFQSWDEIENSAVPAGAHVQPGDIKYVDQNNDGVIDEKDYVVLGNAFPRYTYGFTYNFEWKGLDFSFFLQGVGKRDRAIRGEMVEPFHSNYSYNIYKHQLDFWTPTHTGARWARLEDPSSPSHSNNYGMPSDFYMLDGAYLRLKNIVLGYTLPKRWTRHIGIEKLRVYVNAQDLFTLTKYGFIDPESSEYNSGMAASGGDNSARNYPSLRYYGFGFDIEF